MVMTSYPSIYLDFAANLFSNLGNHTSVFIQCPQNGFFMPAELPEFENGSGRKILNSRIYIISACVV